MAGFGDEIGFVTTVVGLDFDLEFQYPAKLDELKVNKINKGNMFFIVLV
jgi:hypothetical protein